MPVIKIKVEHDLEQIQDRMRYLADDIFQVSGPMIVSRGGWVPAVDVYEASNAIYVVADTAGVDKEELRLVFEGQFLRLSGRRRPPVTLNDKHFYQMEIEYGPFERFIRIPVAVEPEQVEAHYENGFLVIRMLCKKPNDVVNIDVS